MADQEGALDVDAEAAGATPKRAAPGVAREVALEPALAVELLRQAAEPIVACDGDERIILVNEAARRLVRCEIEGLSLSDVAAIWGDLFEGGRRLADDEIPLRRALNGESQVGREVQIARRDGIVQTLLISAAPVREGGAVIAAIASLSEITGFRRSEERYRALVEALPIGILRGNLAGDVLDANDAFLEMVQYSRWELKLGLVRWRDLTPPEFVPLDDAAIAEAVKRGRSTPIEKAYVRRDGTVLPILIGYSMIGANKEEAIAFVLDLSERQAAEEALRDSEARLHLAQDAGGVGVWDWDIVAGQVTWSDSFLRLLGLEAGAVPPTFATFLAALHPDDRARVAGEIQRATTGETYRSEFRVVHPTGDVRWLAAQGEVKKGEDGRPVRMIGVAYDITAQHSLLRQKEMKLREVNHRVKNSLQLVSSLLGMQHSTTENDVLRRQLADADRRILTIAKIHEHLYRGVEPIGAIEFAGYLRDLCRELQDTIAADGGVTIAVDADTAELATDRVISLALVVNELVTNATKYAFGDREAGGRIDISFRRGPDDIYRLNVVDNGRGLPEGYRIEDSSGLGMKVVAGLVRSMQAELDVGSGSGARFTISFSGGLAGAA